VRTGPLDESACTWITWIAWISAAQKPEILAQNLRLLAGNLELLARNLREAVRIFGVTVANSRDAPGVGKGRSEHLERKTDHPGPALIQGDAS
jgi:hypothetical protein